MLAKPFLNELSSTITKKSLESMFVESTLVSQRVADAEKTLITYAQMWIGVNPTSISELFISKSVEYLVLKFPELTFQDIRNGFEENNTEKIPFVQLTIEELVAPVKKYMSKKRLVIEEIKKIEIEEMENQLNIQKEIEFKEHSKQKYLNCLRTGVIDMDVNECNAIVLNMKESYIEEQLAELRPLMLQKAQTEYNTLLLEAKDNPMEVVLIPSIKRLSGKHFIIHCLQQRKNYIEM
jgi:oligoribonuclease (3'-5' exoribonuclease)